MTKKTKAYLWLFFLGQFGAHRFYLNKKYALPMALFGVLTLLLTTTKYGMICHAVLIIWIMTDAYLIKSWVSIENNVHSRRAE